MTLTEQLQDLKFSVLAHWRGESHVLRAFLYCPLLICIPAVLSIAISAIFVFSPPPTLGRILWISAICGTACGVAWWLWGLLQSMHRLLSEQRTWSALVVFIPFVYFGLQFITEMLPDVTSEVAQSLADPEEKRLQAVDRENAWAKKSWRVTPHWDHSRLVAYGDIGHGSAAALRSALKTYPHVRLLEIDSNGGLVSEESRIIEIVRGHRLDTVVLDKCASACTGIFLAGERRFLSGEARFGFHQSGYSGRTKDTEWQIPEYMTAMDFYDRGISKDFAEQALNTSYYELWKPHPFDVRSSGFATAWWSERPAEYR